MLPPELDVKRISQFTLQNNELNAKVLYTFQKPMQYYYWNNGVGCAPSKLFCEGLYIEYIDPYRHSPFLDLSKGRILVSFISLSGEGIYVGKEFFCDQSFLDLMCKDLLSGREFNIEPYIGASIHYNKTARLTFSF